MLLQLTQPYREATQKLRFHTETANTRLEPSAGAAFSKNLPQILRTPGRSPTLRRATKQSLNKQSETFYYSIFHQQFNLMQASWQVVGDLKVDLIQPDESRSKSGKQYAGWLSGYSCLYASHNSG